MTVRNVIELGGVLRQQRRERGWTQSQLAQKAGVQRELVIKAERGHPRLETGKLLDLLHALDIDLQLTPFAPQPGPSLDELLG